MKKKNLRTAGIVMIAIGLSIFGILGYKKISHEIYLRKLLDSSINFEVPVLDIKVPVLEGTENNKLAVSAGHFVGTGEIGSGNYCIAGHNSTIYAEIFNDLDKIHIGDEMFIVDIDENRTRYRYVVTEYTIVEPTAVDVLRDYGDDRITVISCTDDGEYRQVVTGIRED